MIEIQTEHATAERRAGAVGRGAVGWWDVLLGTSVRQSVWGVADQVVVSGTRFFTTIMIGRLCGQGELGIYSLALTFVVLAGTVQESLVSAPYTLYGVRFDDGPRAEYAGSTLVQHGLVSLLAMILLGLLAGLLSAGIGPPGLAPVMWAVAGTIPFWLLREYARRFALAHLRVSTALALDLSVAVVQIAGLAWLVSGGALSAVTAWGATSLACAVGGVVWLVGARARFVVRWHHLAREAQRHWSLGKWILAGQVTSALTWSLIYWLVALVLDTAAAGVFAAYITLVMLSNPLLFGIGNTLAPRAAQAFAAGGGPELRRVIGSATRLVAGAMLVLGGLVFGFGGRLIALLYGQAYAGHEPLVAVLALSMPIGGLSVAMHIGLWGVERPDLNFRAGLVYLAVASAVALTLMKPWGLPGAALGALAGMSAATILQCAGFWRLVGVPAGEAMALGSLDHARSR